MRITIEKEFESRDELDTFVRTKFGEDPEKNSSIVLSMAKDEMQKLALSESTTVHGVSVMEAITEDVVAIEEVKVGKKITKKGKK